MLLLRDLPGRQLENPAQQDQLNSQSIPTHYKGVRNFNFAAHFCQLLDDSAAGKFYSMFQCLSDSYRN